MKDASSFDWNAGNVETLKALLADGHSTREIAQRLGLTRNAVIGKVRRLGLILSPVRHPPKRPKLGRPELPFVDRAKRTPPPPPRKQSGPVHFRGLEQHHFRWIPGEPETQMYCGNERTDSSPYCSHHTRISYSSNA
jgi:GcrA cell cycle regulator